MKKTMARKKIKNPAAVELGRLGGSVSSEAKTRAVRENGKLGGRPKQKAYIAAMKRRKAR